jgi:hypothetical protein
MYSGFSAYNGVLQSGFNTENFLFEIPGKVIAGIPEFHASWSETGFR